MKSSCFGKTGMNISRLGLGTWGLGGIYYGEVPFQQGVDTVRAYLDGGGRHIDTAYSYHQSEEVIGTAIQPVPREELFITSKTYAGCFPDKDNLQEIPVHCEISLRDLGTDYLDCYMIHGSPADRDTLERCLDGFEKLKASGKIRSIGCSIPGPVVTEERVARTLMAIETGRVDCVQLTYSIARQTLGQIFEAAQARGVAVIARWVLESGMLAGKYELGHPFPWPDTRNRYLPEQRDTILQIGHDLKNNLPEGFSSPAEVAVAFALSDPSVTGIILGSNTPEQARRNLNLDRLPPLPGDYLALLKEKYKPINNQCNPTGEFEHVDSPRRPLQETP